MNHLKTPQTNPTTAQYRSVQSNTSTAQYSQVQPIPEPDPKPELFGQTRPEPDPRSKSPTRQTLVLSWGQRPSKSITFFLTVQKIDSSKSQSVCRLGQVWPVDKYCWFCVINESTKFVNRQECWFEEKTSTSTKLVDRTDCWFVFGPESTNGVT